MTKARLGSHRPEMSRKFRTFAGSIMPETMSPLPNIKPTRSWAKMLISTSDDVARDENGDAGRRHERAGRSERARRQSRKSAHAMAAGAAIAAYRPEAHEKPGHDHQRQIA